MTLLENPPTAPLRPPAGASIVSKKPLHLFELQLRIARRADQLARHHGAGRESDRRLWLRAEQEEFERLEPRGA